MGRTLLDDLARRHDLPAPVVANLAAEVAQRCALIANRQGSAKEDGSVEPLGAQIGAAILAAFAAEDRTPDRSTDPGALPIPMTPRQQA